TRDAILLAVAKARSWIDDVASGCVRSFAEIAEREGRKAHRRRFRGLSFRRPDRDVLAVQGRHLPDIGGDLTSSTPCRITWWQEPCRCLQERASRSGVRSRNRTSEG